MKFWQSLKGRVTFDDFEEKIVEHYQHLPYPAHIALFIMKYSKDDL